MSELPRRVGIRFRMEVEVSVPTAWVETHTMKQIEEQSRKDAEGILRDAISSERNIRVLGELGYTFTLAHKDSK